MFVSVSRIPLIFHTIMIPVPLSTYRETIVTYRASLLYKASRLEFLKSLFPNISSVKSAAQSVERATSGKEAMGSISITGVRSQLIWSV